MLCSNCGYENPSEHRYCGMCGTPFPHRALTVPGAQSTLSFTSSPVEVAVAPVHAAPPATQPIVAEPVTGQADPVEQPVMGTQTAATDEPRTVSAEETAPHTGVVAVPEPEAVLPHEEPASAFREDISPPEPPPILHRETQAETHAPQTQAVSEPEPAAEALPIEAEPEAAEGVHEAAPETEPATPVASGPTASVIESAPRVEPRHPSPHVIVMPPPRPAEATPPEVSAQDLAKIHPPPDSLPLSSPPASSGMPTFKEISEASGPPAISPFEPPRETHTAEDRELEDFVAQFRWTPPAETADELTMRSEVPVIDKEAPAEFHHPSFDGDVAPPPEAGPHPTGQEYYAADGTAPRPHFLDVGERPQGSSRQPEERGSSILGADATPAIVPPDELAKASRRRGWLWGSVLALVAIFGGLGYLEGKAQSTHAFRGPVEVALEGYINARQWVRAKIEPAIAAPESGAPETAKATEPGNQGDTTAPPVTAQPEPAQQETSADTNSQPKNTPPESGPPSANAAAENVPMDSAPPKPIEAPLPKPSSKPQPGQQELVKALNASDAAATAAWLWKATSRGNPDAPVRLADMYIRGNGVPKSCEQALVLLRSAATKENAPARNRLAALYANGSCVTRDPVKAYQLLTSALAADPTSDWARENQKLLWSQMTREQRAEAQKPR